MRILIAHAYLNGYGGGERFVLEEADYLAKEHDVSILTWEYAPERTFKEFRNHEIMELKSRGSSFIKMLRWSAYRDNFDLCSTHGFPSNFLSFRNRKTFWYCHRPDLPFQDSMNPYHMVLRSFDRASVRRAEGVITNSRFSAGLMRRYYKREAKVVNPGIDLREFRTGRFGDYVLLVSRISPEKNIELALKIAELVPEMRLVVVAGWVNQSYRKTLEIGGRVKIIENVPDAELKDLYSNCLCVLQTATNESFGMVPLEAMASGKPVLAPDRAGFRESVTSDTGFLLEPEPGLFADKIRYLRDNIKVAKVMGKSGLKRAKRFAWENQMELMGKALGIST